MEQLTMRPADSDESRPIKDLEEAVILAAALLEGKERRYVVDTATTPHRYTLIASDQGEGRSIRVQVIDPLRLNSPRIVLERIVERNR